MSYAQRMHQGLAPERSMMNKGGGGGSSTTTQEIPAELKPLAEQYTNSAINLSNTPYQAYYGQRYADLNPTQFMAMGMTADRALGGDGTINAGVNYLQNTLRGDNNPSAPWNGYIGQNTEGIGYNAYVGANTQIGQNAYAGSNPYLDNAINRSMDDVQTRVNSQFGGSNYGTSANQEVLARELGNVNSQMRMQDYGNQQQLAESAINRSVQAQQADLARNASLAQDTNTFNANLRANDLARNASLEDNFANRQLQAWQLGNSAQANAASLGLGYGNQAYTDASQLLNAGNQMQDQLQQQYDFNYQQFQDQQNLPYKNLAAMSGVFGSNLGSTSTTQQSSGGK